MHEHHSAGSTPSALRGRDVAAAMLREYQRAAFHLCRGIILTPAVLFVLWRSTNSEAHGYLLFFVLLPAALVLGVVMVYARTRARYSRKRDGAVAGGTLLYVFLLVWDAWVKGHYPPLQMLACVGLLALAAGAHVHEARLVDARLASADLTD